MNLVLITQIRAFSKISDFDIRTCNPFFRIAMKQKNCRTRTSTEFSLLLLQKGMTRSQIMPLKKHLFNYNPKLFTHATTSSSEALDRNLSPSNQLPVPAISSNSSPLSPIPEDADVQNGTTIFPVKSLFSIN